MTSKFGFPPVFFGGTDTVDVLAPRNTVTRYKHYFIQLSMIVDRGSYVQMSSSKYQVGLNLKRHVLYGL